MVVQKIPKKRKKQAPNSEYNSITPKKYLFLSFMANLKGLLVTVSIVVAIIFCKQNNDVSQYKKLAQT